MRVFKTKWFGRFARKERLSDQKLAEAVREMEEGLHDGDLGGGLVKKRLARSGEGKRGGYRTIIVYRKGSRAVFLYGFAKSDKENLDPPGTAGISEGGAGVSALERGGYRESVRGGQL